MSAARDRKDAAKVLGLAIQARYRKLLEASGENEITVATVDLATALYENVEFIIWILKSEGGMKPLPPERLHTEIAGLAKPMIEMPAIFQEGKV